jgi:diadenosine tetraphosphatase ApaH/serine/threonine PP2A family protein phosphatase
VSEARHAESRAACGRFERWLRRRDDSLLRTCEGAIRYAILSDVHGNLEALTAVLDDAAAEGARALLCLGDLVGYGADPAACVEQVGERAMAIVAGNHEYGALGRMPLDWFNPAAKAAALWTRSRLDSDHSRYLESLPLKATVEEATLVHASPRHPEEWDYLISAEDGFEVFGDFQTRLCFVGHSHCPDVWSLGSSGPEHPAYLRSPRARVRLEDGRRYIINVGSVGQPRDRDPRAAYAIWDRDERTVTIRRVDYEHQRAAEKIVAVGLPRSLAARLARGV